MNNVKKNRLYTLVMMTVTVILILLLIIPLILSFYAFPMPGDDYSNTLRTVEALKEEGSLCSVLEAAFQYTTNIYIKIQGNFSGIFLMAVNPLLISVSAYQWTLFAINLVFMLCVVWLFWALLKKRWGFDGKAVVMVSLLVLVVGYNRLMSFIEFGCNYISASYYTLPFALAMLYAALLMKISESKKKHVMSLIVLVMLSVFLGLNNFPLALMMISGLFCLTIYALIKKHNVWKRLLILFIVFSLFFAISFFAPGNSVRENTQWKENFGMLATIYASVTLGTKLMLKAIVSTPLLGAMVLLTPILVTRTKKERPPLFIRCFSRL